MDITIKQKKLIFIILGVTLLVFLVIFGINTYYEGYKEDYELSQEYIEEVVDLAKRNTASCLFNNLEDDYRLCCKIRQGFEYGFYYDCTSQDYFEPGQKIYIILNASKLDYLYNPHLTQVYSELEFDYDQPTINILGTQDLSRRRESLLMFTWLDEINFKDESNLKWGNEFDNNYINECEECEDGNLMKIQGFVPEEGESFIILSIVVYPDSNFEREEGKVIIHREARILEEY